MENEQIPPLTSLRFFAASMVVIYHVGPFVGDFSAFPLLKTWIQEAGNAVTLFFVLSGFLITLRYYDKTVSASFDFSTYMVKRAARILPLYFGVLAITLLTSSPAGPPLVYASLTQNYFSDWKLSGIAVAWTLGIEELFYWLAPQLFVLIHRHGLFRALCGAVIGLFALGFFLVQASRLTGLAHFGGFMGSLSDMGHFTLFGRLFDFAASIAAARLFMIHRRRWSSNWALLWGIFLFGFFWLREQTSAPFLIENGVLVLICALIVLSLAMPFGHMARLLSWRPLVYGGKISYALYLIHGAPFIFSLIRSDLPGFFVLVPVLTILAYHVVEKPAQRWIVNRWAVYRSRRLPVQVGA